VSLLCVSAGVFLLYITWFDGGESSEPEAVSQPEPTPVVEVCPSGWRDFDHTAMRFKVCLPANLVFSTGGGTQALTDVDQQDPRFINDFHVVNLAWLNPWPEVIPQDPALPPLRIAIRPPAADLGVEGCPLRAQPVDADGTQSCSDLFFILNGEAVPHPAGDFHRFRALLPAEGQAAGPLFFQADSMTAGWTIQEPLVRQVLDSIRPY
jgi:hypothetical protein